MKKNILKVLSVLCIIFLCVFSALNFLPVAFSSSIYGTTTLVGGNEELVEHYINLYGNQGFMNRWLYGNYFCVDTQRNCSVYEY